MSDKLLRDKEGRRNYILICLLLSPLVIYFGFSRPWNFESDIWETAAAIHEMSLDIAHPDNPMVSNLPGFTSPRFIPYTMLWGFLQGITGLGIFWIIALAGFANFLLFVTGIYKFVKQHYKDAILPAYVMVIMLWVWGVGYNTANAYDLKAMLTTTAYVGIFSFSLCFWALYFLDKFLEKSRLTDLLGYVLLAVLIFVTHPITGLFCFAAALALLLANGKIGKTILLQVVPLIAFGACLIWPYFDYWPVFFKGGPGSLFKTGLDDEQLLALGTAVVGFPIAFIYAWKKQQKFIVWGLALCTLVYLIAIAVPVSICERFIFFLTVFLHFALAVYLKDSEILKWSKIRSSLKTDLILALFLFLLFLPTVHHRVGQVASFMKGTFSFPFKFDFYHGEVYPYYFLEKFLRQRDVVLAPKEEAWVIPCITGAKVVYTGKKEPPDFTLHNNQSILADAKQRREDVLAFYQSNLTSEQRKILLEKYHITHFLINSRSVNTFDPSLVAALKELGTAQISQGFLTLYQVKP